MHPATSTANKPARTRLALLAVGSFFLIKGLAWLALWALIGTELL